MSLTGKFIQTGRLFPRLTQHPHWGAHPSRTLRSCPRYASSHSDLLRGNGSSCAKSVNYWPRCPRARGTMMGEKVGLGGSWMQSSPAARGARCLQRNVKNSSPSCPALTQMHVPRGVGWTQPWALPSLLAVLCKALPQSAIHPKEVKPERKEYCTLPRGMGKG